MQFKSLYSFSDKGVEMFKAFCRGEINDTAVDLSDPDIASEIADTNPFSVQKYETSKEMAEAICNALGQLDLHKQLNNIGLWCWLTFVLRESVFKRGTNGGFKFGALEAWFPSDANDWAKAQRHKVRMPVQLFSQFGDDADHALCGAPHTPGEVREQCTGQQGMFTPTFQKFCRALYFDEARATFKRGAGAKGPGSPRRLAQVVRQLEVTWDVHSFSVKDWHNKVPSEFDRFKENA